MPKHPRFTESGASESVRLAADIIRRHYANPSVGAERGQTGKYAVYFYASERDGGAEFRLVGGFDSVTEAAEAVPFIVADTVIEDVSVWEADSFDPTTDPTGCLKGL